MKDEKPVDATTILTIWLILSGLGHLILMTVVWSNPDFRGMRIRRLISGAFCWYIAFRLESWQTDDWIGTYVTACSWFVAIGGTLLLLGSIALYRSGKDLGKFP